MSFLEELKRRNVVRVGIAYAVAAWIILQLIDVIGEILELPVWAGKLILVMLAVGFVIAVFLAWAFELTPDGIKRESEVDRAQSVTPRTGRRLDRVIIGLLALVVGWFLVDEFYLEPRENAQLANGQPEVTTSRQSNNASTTTPTERRTVAVLPFRSMSSGADDGYFADGLTEELLNSLSQVPELAVTSRTSAFFFKDKDLPIGQIAEQLGVEHVVEGSVRRSGDRLRVTAQLIRVSDDTHLWSETYDRDDADAIAVQEEIAQRIVETLGVFLDDQVLSLMRSAGLRDVTAFIEYQKGRKLHEQAHATELMMPLLIEGNAHLEAALAIQPNFTPAWLFYSDYYTHLLLDQATGERGLNLSQSEITEALEAGRTAFQNAARGASNPGARAGSELDLAIYEGNGKAWRPLLDQLLEIDTCENVIWHQLVGFVPEYAIRFSEAMQRLRACDPMTNRYAGMALSGYVWGGAPERGLTIIGGDKHRFRVEWNIRMLTALEQFDEAESRASIDSTEPRSRQLSQVMIAAARGDRAEAERIDRQMQAGSDNRFLALQRAAWLGDRARANSLAAEIDKEALGHLSLMMTTYWCACGAPFDLDAAPNFAKIWSAAELPWPMESPINFPLKDW